MQTIFPKEEIKTVGDLIKFLNQFQKTAVVTMKDMPCGNGLKLHHAVEYSFHEQKFIELNCNSAIGVNL